MNARWHLFLRSGLACLACTLISACAVAELEQDDALVSSIYWSDGDSGRIDGQAFRLANVDAPETGGVGAAIGPAMCEAERGLGFDAKAFMVELTRDATLTVRADYGLDRLDRRVVDLSADGVDVAEAGVSSGHLRPWPHDRGRALAQKPDWCGGETTDKAND